MSTRAELQVQYDRKVEELGQITIRNEGREQMLPGDAQRYADCERAAAKFKRRLDGMPETRAPVSKAARVAFAAELRGGQPAPAFNVRRGPTGTDVFDAAGLHPEDEGAGPTLRSRALQAIDAWRTSTPDQQEAAARLVSDPTSERDRRVAALHILGAGHPAYVRAFKQMLRTRPEIDAQGNRLPAAPSDPDLKRIWADVNARAMSEQATGTGLALVPPFLDPSVVLASAGGLHPFRTLATVHSITTRSWTGASVGQVTAEYGQESTEAADASVSSFAMLTVTPVKIDCFMPASVEWLADASDADAQLLRLFDDAKSVLESTSWVSGTGSNQTPTGLTVTLDTVTASQSISTATAGLFAMVDVYKASNALSARYRGGSSWVMHPTVLNNLRQVATSPAALMEFPGAEPPKLGGIPVYGATGMLSVITTSADIAVVGNFAAGAVVVDRVGGGVAVYDNNELIGANRRPTQQVAVYGVWRTTFAVVASQAFQMVRVS
jgi:HK97 family phage major capsid protein